MGSAWAAPDVQAKVGKMIEKRLPPVERVQFLGGGVAQEALYAPIRPDPGGRSPPTKPMPVLRGRRECGLRLGARPVYLP